MGRKVILLFAVFVMVAASAFADTIVLKSGKQIDCKILGRGIDAVEIDFNGVKLTYPVEEIDTINGEEVFVVIPQAGVDVQAPATEAPQTQAKPAETSAQLPERISVTAEKQPDSLSLKVDLKEPSASAVKSYKVEVDPAKLKVAQKITAIVLLVILFFGLLVYIYSSICLQFIANKTGTSPAWLAWVPIGNIFLMCKIGSVSYWWLLILLVVFTPAIISMPVGLVFSGFLWYKIALARNKPGWLGILAVVPLVQFVIYGYLAFSNSEGSRPVVPSSVTVKAAPAGAEPVKPKAPGQPTPPPQSPPA